MSIVASQVDISKALQIGGWMSVPELTWLATKAQNHRNIVEFGSLHGRSSRALADNMMEGSRLYCVDPWAGDYYNEDGVNHDKSFTTYVFPYFKRNLQDHIESGRVIPHRGYSYDFNLPLFVDMVFIDGDHRYSNVIRDINKAYSLLRPGGLICGHDYNHPGWPGVKEAVDEFVGKIEKVETIWFSLKS